MLRTMTIHFGSCVKTQISLAGQAIGVKEVKDGIWQSVFITYDLGKIDLEEKTLRPIEKPFGTIM